MQNAPTSLRDLVFVLFKWKWGAITIVVTAVVAAIIYLGFIRSPAYTVVAKILVKIGHEQASPPTLLGSTAPVFSYRSHDVNSEVDILTSQVLIEQLVEHFQMHVKQDPPVPEGLIPRLRYEFKRIKQAAEDLYSEALIRVGFRERLSDKETVVFGIAKGLVVMPMRDSHVIRVEMTLPGRVGSSFILNKYIELYLDYRREIFSDAGAVDFFVTQADDALVALDEAEAELEAFEATHNISNLAKQKEVLLAQIAETRKSLEDVEVEMRDAALKVEKLERELASDDPDIGHLGEFEVNSFSEKLMRDLAELRREAQRLRMKEFEGGTRTMNNRHQFQVLLGVLASNLRAAHAEQVHRFEERQRDLEALEGELAELQASQRGWASAKRRVRVVEQEYLFAREKLEETRALVALEQRKLGNVAVIQPAIDPLLPAGIRKARMFAMIVFIGVLGALVYVALAEFFDHRFYSADALEEQLQAPVLAVISSQPEHDRSERKTGTG